MNEFENTRPDPDKLLNIIKKEEEENIQGKLKIYFGMCAGVGKTYAMLEAAQKARLSGIDVVAGIIETHKRAETEELLKGIEIAPQKTIEYRLSYFNEMDIDVILRRRPSLVLVDELAHSNIPGSRHNKRYQDVLELLNNGIDVYTTLNVQHLESRSEIVKQISGISIRETVPDSIFDKASEIELIDITPAELLQRLSEGKVYTPENSKEAVKNFFRKGNLTALREMALRATAERVDKDLRDYKSRKNIEGTWKTTQRLMVAIGPNPHSADLIRLTRRMAYSIEAVWIAVYVDDGQKIKESSKETLTKNFELAKELGAEIITVVDSDIVSALIRTANENEVTQIIVGKPGKLQMPFYSGNNFIKRLISQSGNIDIYAIGGDRDTRFSLMNYFLSTPHAGIFKYLSALAIIIFTGLILFFIKDAIGYQTVSLIFLLILTFLPLFNYGTGPMLLAATISAFGWDFFFIPPLLTFHIGRIEDYLMFIMYFIVASVSGLLTSRIRAQQRLIYHREKRTNALFNLSKELTASNNVNDIAYVTVKQIGYIFDAEVTLILSDNAKKLNAQPHSISSFTLNDKEWNIAQWVFENAQKAGKFTNTLSDAPATYFPIVSKRGPIGVIGIKVKENERLTFESELFLNSLLTQIANALERDYLNNIAKTSLLTFESEKLYRTLFDSLSHELKTPITTIMGASSTFLDSKVISNPDLIRNLSVEINIAAERLNRLVENLLDMARLESGRLKLKISWHSIPDLVNSALEKLKYDIGKHKIITCYDEDISLVQVDFILLEQALINIIHNCIEYTPENSEIKIEVNNNNGMCNLMISDNGKGFQEEVLPKLFDKFYRIPGTKTGGSGIGLSISKGFIEAHKGTITASNRKTGGAEFTITLPLQLDEAIS